MAHYVEQANLAAAFFATCEAAPEALLFFDKKNGSWQGRTRAEIAEMVGRMAAALDSLGVQPGDRVCIASENRTEWAAADLAIIALGAIAVPAYTTNTEDDHRYILEHSGCVAAFVSGGQIAERVLLAASHCPAVKNLIVMDTAFQPHSQSRISVHYLDKLLAEHPVLADLPDRIAAQDSDDTCCFIYTSGTGGRPKGVMLTHRSIQANIKAAVELLDEGQAREKARFLSLLPLSHSYEHTAGLHLPVQIGAEVWYCEGSEHIASNLVEVQPTLMTAVPRLYEVLHDRITRGVRAKGGLSEKLFNAAARIGMAKVQGQPISLADRLLDPLLDRLVRKKVRSRLGGQLKYFISGGAALNPEIGFFFLGLGVDILQGYGQTEASPLISANRPGHIRIETVGPKVGGVEVKLSDEGELLARGDLLMKGYWKDERTTAATIRDGWLHTGDVAVIHEDGFIEITGRIKDIIVNSGGDNIAPGRVEAILAIEPEIEQVMVDGDKRPWLAAIIVPAEDVRELPEAEQKKIVGEAVERANSRLSQIEKVRRFVLADPPFTTENGQMTPTLKVKRHVVGELYAKRLDSLYKKSRT